MNIGSMILSFVLGVVITYICVIPILTPKSSRWYQDIITNIAKSIKGNSLITWVVIISIVSFIVGYVLTPIMTKVCGW